VVWFSLEALSRRPQLDPLLNLAAYIQANLLGLGHVLEGCRHHGVALLHGVWALGPARHGAVSVHQAMLAGEPIPLSLPASRIQP
jgi:hypothetical protein